MRKEIEIPENSTIKVENGKVIIETLDKPKFKKGDILESTLGHGTVVIYDKMDGSEIFDSIASNSIQQWNRGCILKYYIPASETSKQRLFDYLKSKGKRWNAEKLQVEDDFQEGDLVICWDNSKSEAVICQFSYFDEIWNYHTNFVFYQNAIKFESVEQYKKLISDDK